MDRIDNFKGNIHKLTVEEQSEAGRKSAETRRKKKDLRLALEALLERDYKDKFGNAVSGTEALAAKLFEQAMKGNVKAFETLRDTVGQKPVEKVMIAEVEQSIIDEVERAVFDDTETGA